MQKDHEHLLVVEVKVKFLKVEAIRLWEIGGKEMIVFLSFEGINYMFLLF